MLRNLLSKIRLTHWLLFLLALSLGIVIALLFDIVPFLRGGFGWRWPYTSPSRETVQRLLPGVLTLAVYLAGLTLLRNRRTAVFLTWVMLGAIAMPFAFLTLYGSPVYELYTRTVSLLTTGAYLKAAEFTGLGELLHQWPNEMKAGEGFVHTHVSISPPGWPAIYLLATRLLEQFPALSEPLSLALRRMQCDNLIIMKHTSAQISSALVGMLAPVWAGLTVLPLYLLGRELSGDTSVRRAIAWWPIVPAATLFVGTLNSPYPFLATITMLLLSIGLYRRRCHAVMGNVSLVLAGVFAVLCFAINFAFAPLILLCGIFILLHQGFESRNVFRRDVIEAGALFLLGALSAMVIYRLVAGHYLHDLLRLAMDQHLDLNREYLPWVWLHLWDVILFAGLPIFGLFVINLFRKPRERVRRLGSAVMITLIIMVLSGTGRGETGRLWMFFMPLFLLGVGELLSGLRQKWRVSFMTVQVLWFLTLVAIMRPVGTGLTMPPHYVAVQPPELTGAPLIPIGATFGDALGLAGFQGVHDPAKNTVILDFSWEPRAQLTTSYLFDILAVDPAGSVQATRNWLPVDFRYPTTCWYPENGIVHDRIELELPADRLPGDWWFSLSAFTLEEGQAPVYLPVTLPNGEIDERQIGIGPVNVEP